MGDGAELDWRALIGISGVEDCLVFGRLAVTSVYRGLPLEVLLRQQGSVTQGGRVLLPG